MSNRKRVDVKTLISKPSKVFKSTSAKLGKGTEVKKVDRKLKVTKATGTTNLASTNSNRLEIPVPKLKKQKKISNADLMAAGVKVKR